ncbi:zinc-binding dehydrogenase [Actinocrispum sp. NPDC049592]
MPADLTRLVDRGDVHPVIDARHPIDDIVAAHHKLQRGGGLGKQVIEVK